MLRDAYVQLIASELDLEAAHVSAAAQMFDAGATVPFVARYRRDTTGDMSERKLELLAHRRQQLVSLQQREDSILETIAKQGKLNDELRDRIVGCTDKHALEDLYLPFKRARRTKATAAKESGLEPLARALFDQAEAGAQPEEAAAAYIDAAKAVATAENALEGARNIVAEWISLDGRARHLVRDRMLNEAKVISRSTKLSEGKKTKFETYYDFSENLSAIASYRLLAILRGTREGLLRMELALDDASVVSELERIFVPEPDTPAGQFVRAAVGDAYTDILRPTLEQEVLDDTHQRADEESVRVFQENARNLLLAPAAGAIRVIGLEPQAKNGCVAAVVDESGAVLESLLVPYSEDDTSREQAAQMLKALIEKHNIQAIAVGNGSGSRDALRFARSLLRDEAPDAIFVALVNEAGAAVYSVSKLAREELPDLDVTARRAASVARRLQDPLAELVKVEPRHIGVGQYQHDVNQKRLREGLHETVVSCVNRVGVDLNTASVPMLRYVGGIQYGTAQNIAARREELGGFKTREQLLEVPGVGPKVYEQCAGFLRIVGGDKAFDATRIHPEAYSVVEDMAKSQGIDANDFVGNVELAEAADLSRFVSDAAGPLALIDIRAELRHPGRDPRPAFQAPRLKETVADFADVEVGMELQGIVTNVADFGAFVDVGLGHDGLVHLSELANRFVKDPREEVHVGQVLNVKVIKVEKELERVSLSRRALLPKKPRPARKPSGPRDETAKPGRSEDDAARPRRTGDDRARPRRTERDKDRPRSKPNGKRGERSERGKRRSESDRPRPKPAPKQTTSGDDSSPMNTQLADQLAALREKFTD